MDAFGWVISILIAIILIVLAVKTTLKIIKLIASILFGLLIAGMLAMVYLLSGSAPMYEITDMNILEKDTAFSAFSSLMLGKENISNYNVISFPPCINDYSEQGKIKSRIAGETRTLMAIQTAHRNNLSVYLKIDAYLEKKGIFSIFQNKREKVMLEGDAVDAFLSNIEEMALKYAEVANKTQTRYFTPFSELGCIVGDDKAQEWYSSVIPKIKEKYSGKIIEKINCMQ